MNTYSLEHQNYLKKIKNKKRIIVLLQMAIVIFLLIGWEILAKTGVINSFLTSCPSAILKTIGDLIKNNDLFVHIGVTAYETLLSFALATIIGLFIATLLWWNKTLAKVVDPYLTILNSLPKVSLGPLIIIWAGANVKSIILMAILISIFTTILNMYTAFNKVDADKVTLLKSFGASKIKIFFHLVLRSNLSAIMNTLKVNIGLSFIGVIMGELLVSKQGLGYLITYGSQIFNLNLVITAIFILGILSYLFYLVASYIEKKVSNR